MRTSRAYPRWCGEHEPLLQARQLHEGLPPLVRGALALPLDALPVLRPTPAGAGSTASGSEPCPRRWAYPRWCGEHVNDSIGELSADGLPPLVRGALDDQQSRQGVVGPTPAGAGSTCCESWPTQRPGAYPRWCGEHTMPCQMVASRMGLPPLVRGAPTNTLWLLLGTRPTPAGAGSTWPPRCG